jgi:FMN phosphatase YigB (HAD superfamily)
MWVIVLKKDIEPAKKVGMKTILVDYKNQHENKPEGIFEFRVQCIDELMSIL